MSKLAFYFFNTANPELVKSVFNYNSEICCLRGSNSINLGYGCFTWSAAVQALAILIVKYKHAYLTNNKNNIFISGEKGSGAASLDYAISKSPNWIVDMFGTDSNGGAVSRRLFKRVNPDRKRLGPVEVYVNRHFLSAGDISIKVSNGEANIEDLEIILDKLTPSSDDQQLKLVI